MNQKCYIEELDDLLKCINALQQEIKANGISINTLNNNQLHINKLLLFENERKIKLAEAITCYIKTECSKISNHRSIWYASSDIIESIFVTYKFRKSPNSLYGVTCFCLFLPLHTRMASGKNKVDFKKSLEQVTLSEIKKWGKTNLTENLVTKRINKKWGKTNLTENLVTKRINMLQPQ